MRCAFILFLFAALALPGGDLTGKWAGTLERVGGSPVGPRTDDHFVTLRQSGNEITGTAGPKRDVQWEIRNARLDGKKLSFETAAPENPKFVLVYELEVTESGLAGTVAMKPPRNFNWKLTLKREP